MGQQTTYATFASLSTTRSVLSGRSPINASRGWSLWIDASIHGRMSSNANELPRGVRSRAPHPARSCGRGRVAPPWSLSSMTQAEENPPASAIAARALCNASSVASASVRTVTASPIADRIFARRSLAADKSDAWLRAGHSVVPRVVPPKAVCLITDMVCAVARKRCWSWTKSGRWLRLRLELKVRQTAMVSCSTNG